MSDQPMFPDECPNCGAKGNDPCHNQEWPARVVGRHRERPSLPEEGREERLEKALRDFLDHLHIGCCKITDIQRKRFDAALAPPVATRKSGEGA